MCFSASGQKERAGEASVARAGGAPGRGSRVRAVAQALRRPQSFKPFTYSLMHLTVAIAVAYALTRDWRIALGVGIIEPLVQTVAYTVHEAAWSKGLTKQARRSG